MGIALILSMILDNFEISMVIIAILATLFETKKLSDKESELLNQTILNRNNKNSKTLYKRG
jgi:hypothetical protein